MEALGLIGGVVLAVVIALTAFWVITLRRVVNTNEVHIVQSSKQTVSYGKGEAAGNTYYEFPAWLPVIGIQVIKLPVSVFSQRLENYEAYDKGRLPFVLDMEAFFRIDNSNQAAQRVANFGELKSQLGSILQGAARSILASKDIEEIMQGRAEFGEAFTKEVNEQLKAWGVTTVKNIELMDIRDSKGSKVIGNIMEKKKSLIERESRVEVAENNKIAEQAEIDAVREVELNKQKAQEQVGIRTAEKERAVGIALEQSKQEVKAQEKVTAERQMEVTRVQDVKSAEIAKDVNVVKAEERKQTDVISAEGEKQKTVIIAEGKLEAERRSAEAITLNGAANAEAKKLLELAPVQAQITLAKEIGENAGYQSYLVTLRQVEASEKIGIEQAKALVDADIKVIANGGDVATGINSIGDIFSSKGGTGLASSLTALAATPEGQGLINRFLAPKE